jgi:hypothetical protein
MSWEAWFWLILNTALLVCCIWCFRDMIAMSENAVSRMSTNNECKEADHGAVDEKSP